MNCGGIDCALDFEALITICLGLLVPFCVLLVAVETVIDFLIAHAPRTSTQLTYFSLARVSDAAVFFLSRLDLLDPSPINILHGHRRHSPYFSSLGNRLTKSDRTHAETHPPFRARAEHFPAKIAQYTISSTFYLHSYMQCPKDKTNPIIPK